MPPSEGCQLNNCHLGYPKIPRSELSDKQRHHLRIYHEYTQVVEVTINRIRFKFNRDPTIEMRYRCVCEKEYKNPYNFKVHVEGNGRNRKACRTVFVKSNEANMKDQGKTTHYSCEKVPSQKDVKEDDAPDEGEEFLKDVDNPNSGHDMDLCPNEGNHSGVVDVGGKGNDRMHCATRSSKRMGRKSYSARKALKK